MFVRMNCIEKKNEFINSKNSKKKQYSSIFSKVNIIENIWNSKMYNSESKKLLKILKKRIFKNI